MRRSFNYLWIGAFLALSAALFFTLSAWQTSRAKGVDAGPDVYAIVHIDRHPQRLLEDTPVDRAEADDFCRTQAFLVRCRPVLNAALRSPKVTELAVVADQKDPLGWLERHVRAELLDTPGMLRVWVRAGTPTEQAVLTNAIVTAYLEEGVNRERTQTQKMVDQLKDWAERYDQRIKRNRDNLRSLKQTIGADDNPARELRQQMAIREIKALQEERLMVRSELRRLRLERELLDDRAETPVPEGDFEQVLKQDPQGSRLQEEAARLESLAADMAKASINPNKDSAYAATQEKLKAARKRLQTRREELRASTAAALQERQRGKERDDRRQMERRIKLLEKLAAQLGDEIEHLSRPKGIVENHLDIEDISHDIAHLEEMSKSMKARAEKLTIQVEAPNRVYILQQASAPR